MDLFEMLSMDTHQPHNEPKTNDPPVEVTVNNEAIDEFKHALLSRDPDVQLAGLRAVIDLIKANSEHQNTLRDGLVNSDVVECLGETISSFNISVVCASLSLLEELILSKLFVSQNRASVIVKSILRSCMMFAEVSNDGRVVQPGLELVSKIIMILVQDGKELKTFCDVDQLVNVGQTILKSSSENLSILQSVSQIVYTVLLSSEALLEDESTKEVGFPHLVAEVLNRLCRATHVSPDIDIDTAVCEVSAACMRLFLKVDGCKKEVLETFHAMIRTAMTKLIVPHITEWVGLIDQDSVREMVALLKGVMSIYHYPDPAEKLKYSKQLVEADFLKILHSLELLCRTWEQYMVVRSLLVEILVCMCSNELGVMDWSTIVNESLKILPAQGTMSRLEAYSFQDPISTTLIAYNYFILMTSTCPDLDVNLFKDVCTHVNLVKSPPPSPVFKAVWLCFAIGYMTHGENCYLAEKANNAVISLAATYDIKTIFTHHPAILFWTFRSENILRDFKAAIMNLWINKEDEDMLHELKSLLSQSREAFTLYLEQLASRCIDVKSISKHLAILPKVMQQCDELLIELVSYDAWSLLPQVLLQSCLRIDSYGMIPLLVFCSEFQPEAIDQDLLFRISSMIPGAISKHNAISAPQTNGLPAREDPLKYVVIFKFMYILLNKVQEKNESMILSPLLNHEGFIIALEYSFTLEHEELTIVVMELLSTLLSLQHKHSTISCRSVVLSGADFTKLLYRRGGIATTSVAMLHRLLIADNETFSSKLLLTIQQPLDHIRVIYTRLHMICYLATDEVATWCWTCLHRLLLYAQDSCALLGRHLAGLAYTHELIRNCPPGTSAWDAMNGFLSVWLPSQHPTIGERSLGKVALDETLTRLAQAHVSLDS